jgi:hypothetical protein
MCVGGMGASNSVPATSTAYENLGSGIASDREDPDVVALSTAIHVMDYTALTGNATIRSGTSFAAPAITAMSALLKQACYKNLGLALEQKYVRSILMNSAWFFNLDDSLGVPNNALRHYSTPDANNPSDYEDGAGGPIADNAMLWCGTKSSTLTTGGGPVDVDLTGTNAQPPPEWMDGTGLTSNAVADDSLVTYSSGLSFKYYDVTTLKALPAGTRVRVTMNWDACPVGKTGTGPSPLSADLDLFLCSDKIQKCFKSRSCQNNWEGFDTADGGNITTDSNGDPVDWTIRVGYEPSTSPGCNGKTTEPMAYAFVAGPAGAFKENSP